MCIRDRVYYSEGIDKLVVNMGEVSPHFMTAVPRFYDSLHTRISQGLKKQGKLSQTLFAATLRLGKKKYNGEKLSFIENLTNNIRYQTYRIFKQLTKYQTLILCQLCYLESLLAP